MNKIRRAALQVIAEKVQELRDELETIRDEEEEYRDNIPENMQASERYEKAEEAVGNPRASASGTTARRLSSRVLL